MKKSKTVILLSLYKQNKYSKQILFKIWKHNIEEFSTNYTTLNRYVIKSVLNVIIKDNLLCLGEKELYIRHLSRTTEIPRTKIKKIVNCLITNKYIYEFKNKNSSIIFLSLPKCKI